MQTEDRMSAATPSHPLKRRAFLALLLLVPAPSIGVLFAMMLFPGTKAASAAFAASKLWLFGLPVVWHLFIDKERLSFSPPRRGGFGAGLLSGILISLMIWLAYRWLGAALIDRRVMVEQIARIGLGTPAAYFGGAAYWILINSVLEEYVWRWFTVKKCEALLAPKAAVLCSALFFTLHHTLAMQVYFSPGAVLLCSAGVFAGGAIWSLMYIRYRSIWPGYLSHAIVDLCIFAIGAVLLFG